MTDPHPTELIRSIHASPVEVALAVTGGGAGAIATLLRVPGASRTVLEAVVPYASTALSQYLGAIPESYCSERTARGMAMAAFERARAYASPKKPPEQLAGVGATASLASDRPKLGPHRIYVALQTAQRTQSWSLELTKGQRDRAQEEDLSANLVLRAVAEACGLAQLPPIPTLVGEEIRSDQMTAPSSWSSLLLGEREKVWVGGQEPEPAPSGEVVFPGAFNPLHAGHREMVRLAREQLGKPVRLEISVENVDKPPLDFCELRDRLAQLDDFSVWLTRAATFEKKSELFPGALFLVGIDTLARIAEPKYYGNDPVRMQTAIEQIAGRGCRFLVFGRLQAEIGFQAVDDLALPTRLREICQQVPAEQFRKDIASTDLRRTNYDEIST